MIDARRGAGVLALRVLNVIDERRLEGLGVEQQLIDGNIVFRRVRHVATSIEGRLDLQRPPPIQPTLHPARFARADFAGVSAAGISERTAARFTRPGGS